MRFFSIYGVTLNNVLRYLVPWYYNTLANRGIRGSLYQKKTNEDAIEDYIYNIRLKWHIK